jgi:S1-C subfamily serine protease
MSGMQRHVLAATASVIGALVMASCTSTDPTTPPPTATPSAAAPTISLGPAADPFAIVEQIVEQVSPSVVTVLTPQGLGSGVIYSSDGVVVTNHHVVEGSSEWLVALASGERVPAELVGSDPLTDVAVLRIERSGLPAAEFDTDLPPRGTLAVAIGSPLGFLNSVTVGVVSGAGRAIPGAAANAPALVDLIQTDAAISPGNSGGALVGDDGRVMGINVAHIPPQAQAETIGFAIPAGTVVDVVEAILAGRPVEHAYLGVNLAQVTPQMAQQFGLSVEAGAAITDIAPGSPAESSELRAGDVIVATDGEPVRTVEDLLTQLRQRSPGETVQLSVARGAEELAISVTLGQRPPIQTP